MSLWSAVRCRSCGEGPLEVPLILDPDRGFGSGLEEEAHCLRAMISAAAFSGDTPQGSVRVRTSRVRAERGGFSGMVCGLRTGKP